MMREDSAQQSGGWGSDDDNNNEEYIDTGIIETTSQKVNSLNNRKQEPFKVYTVESIEKVQMEKA